jgi:hypothetical protein
MQGLLAKESGTEDIDLMKGQMPKEAGMEEDEEDSGPEGDEALDAAMEAVRQKLYDEDVADGIAQAIMSAPNPVQGIVEQATMLLGMADDITGNMVPDDLYVVFAVGVMTEVGEIAEAAGVEMSGAEMAEALKLYVTTTIQNLGGDTSEVEQALAALDMNEVGAKLDTLRED